MSKEKVPNKKWMKERAVDWDHNWLCGDCGNVNQNGDAWCIACHDKTCRKPEEQTMKSPYEQGKAYPEIKEGSKFVVVLNDDFCTAKIGEIVTLYRNDGTHNPWFMLQSKNSENNYVISWHLLAPLTNTCPTCGQAMPRHRYTDEQIQEAKQICKRLLCKAFDDGLSVVFYVGNTTSACTDYGSPFKVNTKSAKCSETDEYNEWIGRLVALCKLLGESYPSWVR